MKTTTNSGLVQFEADPGEPLRLAVDLSAWQPANATDPITDYSKLMNPGAPFCGGMLAKTSQGSLIDAALLPRFTKLRAAYSGMLPDSAYIGLYHFVDETVDAASQSAAFSDALRQLPPWAYHNFLDIEGLHLQAKIQIACEMKRFRPSFGVYTNVPTLSFMASVLSASEFADLTSGPLWLAGYGMALVQPANPVALARFQQKGTPAMWQFSDGDYNRRFYLKQGDADPVLYTSQNIPNYFHNPPIPRWTDQFGIRAGSALDVSIILA